jgi:hypothetical protein
MKRQATFCYYHKRVYTCCIQYNSTLMYSTSRPYNIIFVNYFRKGIQYISSWCDNWCCTINFLSTLFPISFCVEGYEISRNKQNFVAFVNKFLRNFVFSLPFMVKIGSHEKKENKLFEIRWLFRHENNEVNKRTFIFCFSCTSICINVNRPLTNRFHTNIVVC